MGACGATPAICARSPHAGTPPVRVGYVYAPHETLPRDLVVLSAKDLKTRATAPWRAGQSNEQDKTYEEFFVRKYTLRASVHELDTLWGGPPTPAQVKTKR